LLKGNPLPSTHKRHTLSVKISGDIVPVNFDLHPIDAHKGC
jgi:hypothetical protein